MIKAITLHAWLLLTCRHNGAGLPTKSYMGVFGAFALCCIIASIRWNGTYEALQAIAAMAFILWFIASFSIRAATGYALISVTIDIIAMVIAPFAEIATYVEAITTIVFFLRIFWKTHLGKKNDRH